MATLITSLQKHFQGSESCICITGSGGKTTALIQLANAYAAEMKRVLVSTTTKVLYPEDRDYYCDRYFWDEDVFSYQCKKGERVFYARRGPIKAEAPPTEDLARLKEHYDVLLLEADGARGMGLKLHCDRDPVVPEFTTATLAIASFSVFGKRLSEHCFGCEALPDRLIDEETYSFLLTHPEGIQKGMKGVRAILFNQAERTDWSKIENIRRSFPDLPLFFGSLEENILIERKIP
ncbi:MAG: selenium cofactor biosynthesis protein YqeC [Sphaerochaetaceae bacterium]|nr:selenium cofactor biosynthesis protein YqeC [Sphaerochaetaceae bacterium]